MKLTPLQGRVLVEIIRQTDVKRQQLQASAPSLQGLEIPSPDNKRHGFEGIPDRGVVYALPPDYKGELKVGMTVVFKEQNPTAVKYEGLKLFNLDIEQIMAVLDNA